MKVDPYLETSPPPAFPYFHTDLKLIDRKSAKALITQVLTRRYLISHDAKVVVSRVLFI